MFKRVGTPNQIDNVCAITYLLKHETWSGSGQAFKWGPKATSEKKSPAVANLDLEKLQPLQRY